MALGDPQVEPFLKPYTQCVIPAGILFLMEELFDVFLSYGNQDAIDFLCFYWFSRLQLFNQPPYCVGRVLQGTTDSHSHPDALIVLHGGKFRLCCISCEDTEIVFNFACCFCRFIGTHRAAAAYTSNNFYVRMSLENRFHLANAFSWIDGACFCYNGCVRR